MNSAVRRPFAAERQKTSAQAKDVTIADLMQKLTDLESGLNQGFADKFDRLCEQLEVIVEDENETKVSVDDVMAEIHAMNAHIVSTKEEVAALKPADDASTTVTAVAAELTEVVKATEDAANTILENVENLEAVSATMRENVSAGDPDGMLPDLDRLENISMELLTACSFQDITGQRINKIVNSLDYVEARLQKMIEIWKVEHGTADIQAIALGENDERPDKDMLHGPQDNGMDQDSIDALFE